MGDGLEQTLAVLNGLVGDYLVKSGNGLATEMALYDNGVRVPLQREHLARALPNAGGRVALFVHGVMCTETVWRFPDGSDYGRKLQQDLGITPVYLRYNSGLPVADNGAALAELIERLLSVYPVPMRELIPIGYSMGGLLVRSACHAASERGLSFLPKIRRAIYVGTPHLGAPAERVGRVVARLLRAVPDPTTRLIGQISDLRSAGIQDLGDADLRTQDRAQLLGRLSLRDARHPLPLLPGIAHALAAGSLWVDARVAALFGDSIVPLGSATADSMRRVEQLDLPAERVQVFSGRNHLDLAHDAEVYEFIKRCCEEPS